MLQELLQEITSLLHVPEEEEQPYRIRNLHQKSRPTIHETLEHDDGALSLPEEDEEEVDEEKQAHATIYDNIF